MNFLIWIVFCFVLGMGLGSIMGLWAYAVVMPIIVAGTVFLSHKGSF